jgi:hypothetical protein
MANEADDYDAPVSIPRQRLATFATVARPEAWLRGLNDQKRPSRHRGTTEDVSATTAKSAEGGGNPLTASMVRCYLIICSFRKVLTEKVQDN